MPSLSDIAYGIGFSAIAVASLAVIAQWGVGRFSGRGWRRVERISVLVGVGFGIAGHLLNGQ